MLETSTNTASRIFLVLVGVAIPSIVLGRSVIAVELIASLICIPFLCDRTEILTRAKGEMRTVGGLIILVTFAMWIPSLFVSVDFLVSLKTMTRSMLYIVSSVFVWSAMVSSPRLPDSCLRVLVVASFFFMGLAVLEMLGLSDLISLVRGHGWDGYPDDRMIKETAISGAIVTPLLVWAAFRLRGIWAVLGILAIIEAFWLMKLTVNRSAVAGVLAFLITVGLLSAVHKRSFKVGILAILGVILCCSAVIAWLYIRFDPHYLGGSDDLLLPKWLIDPQRQEIWAFSWQASELNRWFGVGVNVIDKLPNASDWNMETGARNIPLHPHSWIVEIIVETGVFGFAAMLMSIGYFVVKWMRGYLATGDLALLAVLGVWAAYWAASLFSVSYWSSWLQASFLVATILCLAGRQNAARSPGRQTE